MKRLALLLAAMGVVSAAAFAGELQITNVGQKLEYEHENHATTSDAKLFTNVGLKYEDWTFGIEAGKFWKYGTKTAAKKGLSSNNGRLQLDVWKSLTPEFKLGYRFRGEKDVDKHYIRYDYAHDWFTSSADIWYASVNEHNNNNVEMELFPLGVKYNGFAAKWFVNYGKNIKSNPANHVKSFYEHQIRLYAPVYSDDAFALSAEGRFTLAAGKSVKDNAPYSYYKNFGRTRLILNASYKVTDSFSVYGFYGYEFRSFKTKNEGTKPAVGDKSYHDVGIGWNYTF